jgi:hypothetical protein
VKLKIFIVSVILVAGLGIMRFVTASSPTPEFGTPVLEKSQYDCAKKLCKNMVSCEEACYKLKVCGHTQLDRDKDNIPCENVCSSPCPPVPNPAK